MCTNFSNIQRKDEISDTLLRYFHQFGRVVVKIIYRNKTARESSKPSTV